MYSSIKSAALSGIVGTVINVEVHTSSGFPGFTVVGMPDTAMRESKDRIRAAMISSGLNWPQSRVTINMAPASVRKNGTGTELAVLVGLLCATKELDARRFDNAGIIGEVGLNGCIHDVTGTIARVLALKNEGMTEVFVPRTSAHEAQLIEGMTVYPIESVAGLIGCLTQGEPWPDPDPPTKTEEHTLWGDYCEISGQSRGCEAMMVLAAGGHHTLLMGSPGVGKTMLAERLPSILPTLELEESHIATAIESVMKGRADCLTQTRPFRQPHHSASAIAMIGGGSTHAIPGEVTHAHKGVLFLDELSEFSHSTLDMLRQPLEAGCVSVARAQFKVDLPADFTLLACSNPCPCAKERNQCICSDSTRQRYAKKLSGPLLDRFDVRLELFNSSYEQGTTHTSQQMRDKVFLARERQKSRQEICNGKLNSRLSAKELVDVAPLSDEVEALFRNRIMTREFSTRGAVAIWRVARTLADLDDSTDIEDSHMAHAFDMRETIA